jgi:hypothetical protein
MDLPEKRRLTCLLHLMGHECLQEILHASAELMRLVVQDWDLLDDQFRGILYCLNRPLIMGVLPFTLCFRASVLRRFC